MLVSVICGGRTKLGRGLLYHLHMIHSEQQDVLRDGVSLLERFVLQTAAHRGPFLASRAIAALVLFGGRPKEDNY